MSTSLVARVIYSLALGAALVTSTTAIADPIADFYRDKTLTITFGSSAGGSLGLYCRLLAQYWTEHIPGKPT
jgi:tripartite-type tricarboxylate transporter receptor subunit TctC